MLSACIFSQYAPKGICSNKLKAGSQLRDRLFYKYTIWCLIGGVGADGRMDNLPVLNFLCETDFYDLSQWYMKLVPKSYLSEVSLQGTLAELLST